MATGQIGFHRQKQVRKVHIEKRVNEIINRINKTKLEKFPDLAAKKAEFEKEERRKEKIALQEKVRPLVFRGVEVYAKACTEEGGGTGGEGEEASDGEGAEDV